MQTSTKIILGLIVVVLIVLGFTAFSRTAESKTVRIGVLAPLTGPAPSIGEWMLEGVQMATKETNTAGGVGGKSIELVVEDDACGAKQGVDAYHKLHNAQGIQYFVGPVCGAARVPILEAAKDDQTVLITTGLALVTSPASKAITFNVVPSAWAVAQKIAEFGVSRNYKKMSVLFTDDVYGKENDLALQDYAKTHEFTIPSNESYVRGAPDLRTQILKFKNDGSDAVLVAAYGPDYATFMKQAKELGFNKPILAMSNIQVPEAAAMEKQTGQTIYYSYPAASSAQSVVDFANKYRKQNPDAPNFLPMYIGTGYDALNLLSKALTSCGEQSPDCVRTYFENTKDYQGANGPITFGALGNNTNNATIEVRKLEGGDFRQI